MLKRAVGATLLLVLMSMPAGAAEYFCGLLSGSVCPPLVQMQLKLGGEVWSHLSADRAADKVARLRPKRVVLVGYSCGVEAAIEAARKLGKRGIRVHTLVLFDGATRFCVTRSIPSNVDLAVHWRQDGILGGARICNGKVVGGICKQRSGRTHIFEETVPLNHFSIASDPFIRAQAEALIRGK